MAEHHVHGEMDTTEQEKTFGAFMRWVTNTAIFCIILLIFIGLAEVGCVITSGVLIAQQAPERIRGSIIGIFNLVGAVGNPWLCSGMPPDAVISAPVTGMPSGVVTVKTQ